MSDYVGDIRLGDTFDVKFCTVSTTGAPTTLAGSPSVAAYPGNSTTEVTAGITLTVDFDSRTGLHNVRVVASGGNGYATATNYQLVLTAGTVGGTSVVGYVVGQFSIENRSALMPTTAARTLDVTATGEAGLDWANIGAPTTTVALSGTTVGTVSALAAGSVTAAVIADNAIDRATFAADTGLQTTRSATAQAGAAGTITLDASASATDSFYVGCLIAITGGTGVGQARLCTAYVGATKVATVSRNWVTNPDNTSTFAVVSVEQGKVDSSLRTTDVNSANLDAAVSTRLATAGYTAPLDAAGTRTAVGLASANLDTQLTAIDDYIDTEVAAILAAVDTEVAAIKAKTDNLPEGVQKNTALGNFPFFMADSSDHVTGKTGLTVTGQRSIDGGAFANCTNTGTIAEIANGWYKISLSAADLNGDLIALKFTATGADATSITIKTEA